MTRPYVFACLVAVITCALACAQQPGGAGWLNARDFGASGSEFQTTAKTTAGSNVIEVADVGDFRVGQGVMVSRCNIQVEGRLYGPGSPYSSMQKLEDKVQLRGYDGAAGSWLVYILEVQTADPVTFRWSDDLARSWAAKDVPVSYDWQPLSNGVEVRFTRQDWQPGHMITFTLRDQLVTVIDKIEGNQLTLRDPANRSAEDAVLMHNDTQALRTALSQAITTKRNLYVPNGRYRLSGSLVLNKPSITIEGQSASDTILDISNGTGPCLILYGGQEVTVRNFTMVGHTGMAEAAGAFRTSSGQSYWACHQKSCSAIGLAGTERVLIENVHAYRMASEAFYAQAACRTSDNEPPQYQKSLTYYRCSVTDCAANAFNNNDTGENTSVLYCRVDGAGWHAAEMPAKFFRFIGNYVRNSGPVTVGDMNHRLDDLHRLGCGQAIVADNVFEGIGKCGGIAVNYGSGQVVVNSNLFINYNGPAIRTSSITTDTSFPSRSVVITNNIIDLTYLGEDPRPRTGIAVSTSDTIVSNNQIFARGPLDERVTGITISEPALNVSVHDNQVSNCAVGLSTGRARGTVTQVLDSSTFKASRIPLEWANSHLYRGWGVVWLSGEQVTGQSVLDHFDAQETNFILTQPRELKVGESFEIFPPYGANWRISRNTITGCQTPVLLDSYGSETSVFQDNIITRGPVSGVKAAIAVRGWFQLIGNRISGFDEEGAVALSLYADRAGRQIPLLCTRNIFESCATAVAASEPGMWTEEMAAGNVFIN